MRVGGDDYRSIWLDEASGALKIIDQTTLPHLFEIKTIESLEDAAEAIASMRVRGAPLIGATAAHGIAIALSVDPSDEALSHAAERLISTRPTAVNLRWAVARMCRAVEGRSPRERAEVARAEARAVCDEDVAACEAIGEHGLALLKDIARTRDGGRVRVLTHCNAGWLATVDWGTALAPIFKAHQAGIPVEVWVDETRPRNQGAALTAFELREQGVPHTVVVDNAGGHLMQRGLVDIVLVGSDRTTARGDVCNKIGTYLKALAAEANGVPFYVALPTSTIDWESEDGLVDIPIEARSEREVRMMSGLDSAGQLTEVALFPEATPSANPAFDITPARYVTGLITEHGLVSASRLAMAELKATLPASSTSVSSSSSSSSMAVQTDIPGR